MRLVCPSVGQSVSWFAYHAFVKITKNQLKEPKPSSLRTHRWTYGLCCSLFSSSYLIAKAGMLGSVWILNRHVTVALGCTSFNIRVSTIHFLGCRRRPSSVGRQWRAMLIIKRQFETRLQLYPKCFQTRYGMKAESLPCAPNALRMELLQDIESGLG